MTGRTKGPDLLSGGNPQIPKGEGDGPVQAYIADGWFVAFRCYTKYVQLQFFRGASLDPVPPKGSKHPEVRYLDIHEDDEVDDARLEAWIRQASELPGEVM